MLLNAQIPASLELVPREQVHSPWLIGFFVGCILLVVVARLFQRDVFSLVLQGGVLFRSIDDMNKDGKRLTYVSTLLLLLQFFFITCYLYYVKILGKRVELPQSKDWYIFAVLPAYWMYLIVVQWLTGFLVKRIALIREIQFYTQTVSDVIGLFLLLVLFVDFFEPFLQIEGNWWMLLAVGSVFILRFLRGFIMAIQEGIPWYYIILYFWTLEILPVLVALKLLQPELFREWFS